VAVKSLRASSSVNTSKVTSSAPGPVQLVIAAGSGIFLS
jgi:hypothetical protein